ncbi:hypothetical protein AMAG_03496 [Allomyces macrogynus ATCC 38327]|uniref:C2 domain-containing protein n=1 Tax=Allomyces macrogynus (strain ATCC 38327) TaxID=578462 RepID=A0A0L0S9V2_ALLM3|nr:hypothetical protein AMAG_03496 [Allomyces macrogynus ATCC 38327]|eukprot:KNE59170.1 hypothetical protein AMAG_03496 [Allomyces macrogynus ATCC 38327]
MSTTAAPALAPAAAPAPTAAANTTAVAAAAVPAAASSETAADPNAATTTATANTSGVQQPMPGDWFSIRPKPLTKGISLLEPGAPVAPPVLVFGLFNPSDYTFLRSGALIFAFAFTLWIVAGFGRASLSAVVLITLPFVHYWANTQRKLAAQLRIEAEYAASRRRLQLGTEEADWFNRILGRFWLAYEPTLSQTIQASVEPLLEYYCPAIIDSMKFDHFTLGTFPPQLRAIVSARNTEPDLVDFEFDVVLGHFSGTNGAALVGATHAAAEGGDGAVDGAQASASAMSAPADLTTPETDENGPASPTSDTSSTNEEPRTDSKVDLVVRMKGGMPIKVRASGITVEGRMRIRMKLMTSFPHIKVLELWFLDAPKIAFELRPMGRLLNLNSISIIRKTLDDLIAWGIGVALVYPVPLVIPLDDWFNNPAAVADANVGVLMLHIHNAQGLKNVELLGKSDPFCKIVVNSTTQARTHHISNNLDPAWDEIKFVPIGKLTESNVRLEVCDYDKMSSGRMLGYVDLDLPALMDDVDGTKGSGTFQLTEFQLLDSERRPRGKLRVSGAYYTTAPADIAPTLSLDACPSGLLKVTVHAAKSLEAGGKLRSPYFQAAFNGEQLLRSRTKKHTPNPLWEESFEVFVPDAKAAKLHVGIFHDEGLVKKIATVSSGDAPLGQCTISVHAALKKDAKDDWYTLQDATNRDAKVRMTLRWRPVPLKRDAAASATGVLRVRVINVDDIKSNARPYVRLLTSGKSRAQTRTVPAGPLPRVFQETLFALVRDIADPVLVQVWDNNRGFKDSLIGTGTIDLSQYVTVAPATGDLVPRSETAAGSGNGVAELDDIRLYGGEAGLMTTKTRGRLAVELSYHAKKPDLTFSPDADDIGGILKVRLHQARDLSKKTSTYVELYLDDPKLPVFCTATRKKSAEPILRAVGRKCLVRQLLLAEAQWGRWAGILGRCCGPGGKDPILGSYEGYVYDVYKQTTEKWFDIGGSGKLKMSFAFTPVACVIDPTESITNMGYLYLEIVSATNLPVMDRSGRSDPFVVVYLNDEKWHRTTVQRKNLNPVWKERTKLPLVNRSRSQVRFDIFDWDRVGENELITSLDLDVANIAPDEQVTVNLPLADRSGFGEDEQPGYLTVSYRFEAQRITKLPSRTLAKTKAALDRLDPRKRMGAGGKFGMGTNAAASATLARPTSGVGAAGGTDQASTVVGTMSAGSLPSGSGAPGDGASMFSTPVAEDASGGPLLRSASTDFGSNSSLNTYVEDHVDKVAERGALAVTVVEAVHLPAVDADGASDPYIKVRCVPPTPPGAGSFATPPKKIRFDTRTILDNCNPVWEQTFTSALPRMATQLGAPMDPLTWSFAVWDSNKITSDRELGMVELNLWDVVADRVRRGKHVMDPAGSGWAYVRHDLWVTLVLNADALAVAVKLDKAGTTQAAALLAEHKTAAPQDENGDDENGVSARPRLHLHMAVLLPPWLMARVAQYASTLPPTMQFLPPAAEPAIDDSWRDEIAFPASLWTAQQAQASLTPSSSVSAFPVDSAADTSSGWLNLPPPPARGRAGSSQSDHSQAPTTVAPSKSAGHRFTAGLRKAFKRNKDKDKGSGSIPQSEEGSMAELTGHGHHFF